MGGTTMATKAIKSAASDDLDDEDVVKGGLVEEIWKQELPLPSIAGVAGKDGESHYPPLPVLLLQQQQLVPTANQRCVLCPGPHIRWALAFRICPTSKYNDLNDVLTEYSTSTLPHKEIDQNVREMVTAWFLTTVNTQPTTNTATSNINND